MQFRKEDMFTIPNILTYIRLIALPFFLWMMFGSLAKEGATEFIYITIGLAIFVFAEVTDILDGKIARKYNLVTDIGKVLDPIADKLLQCFAVLTLSVITKNVFVWIFAGVLIAKEIAMGVQSKYIMRASKRQVEQMANRVGKNGAVFNFVEVCLLFLYNLLTHLFWAFNEVPIWYSVICDVIKYVIIVWGMFCCVWQIYAFANYTRIYTNRLNEVRKSGILDTLDRNGNPLPKDDDAKVEEAK